jgi:hypothetical protein
MREGVCTDEGKQNITILFCKNYLKQKVNIFPTKAMTVLTDSLVSCILVYSFRLFSRGRFQLNHFIPTQRQPVSICNLVHGDITRIWGTLFTEALSALEKTFIQMYFSLGELPEQSVQSDDLSKPADCWNQWSDQPLKQHLLKYELQ